MNEPFKDEPINNIDDLSRMLSLLYYRDQLPMLADSDENRESLWDRLAVEAPQHSELILDFHRAMVDARQVIRNFQNIYPPFRSFFNTAFIQYDTPIVSLLTDITVARLMNDIGGCDPSYNTIDEVETVLTELELSTGKDLRIPQRQEDNLTGQDIMKSILTRQLRYRRISVATH